MCSSAYAQHVSRNICSSSSNIEAKLCDFKEVIDKSSMYVSLSTRTGALSMHAHLQPYIVVAISDLLGNIFQVYDFIFSVDISIESALNLCEAYDCHIYFACS